MVYLLDFNFLEFSTFVELIFYGFRFFWCIQNHHGKYWFKILFIFSWAFKTNTLLLLDNWLISKDSTNELLLWATFQFFNGNVMYYWCFSYEQISLFNHNFLFVCRILAIKVQVFFYLLVQFWAKVNSYGFILENYSRIHRTT